MFLPNTHRLNEKMHFRKQIFLKFFDLFLFYKQGSVNKNETLKIKFN